MSKGKNFIVSLEVYPFDIFFSIGQTDKRFFKEIKKVFSKGNYKKIINDEFFYMDKLGNGSGKTEHSKSKGHTIIRIKGNINSAYLHGVLAHEIFHAIELIFRSVGIKLHNKSDEAYSYAIGYVTKKVYEEIKG